MKYLFYSLFSFFAISVTAQSNQLTNQANEIQQLISTFKESKDSKDIQLLMKADELLTEVMKDNVQAKNPKILLTQAQLLTLQLEHQDQDDPMVTCTNIEQAYSSALSEDTRMTLRHEIMGDVYTSKILMMKKGNDAYEDNNYDTAHNYYSQLLQLNKLEVDYPRHARVDSSMMFTSAVFAKLAGKTDIAISSFEELVAMDFNRKEMYTYLEQLYIEKKQPEKAEQIIKAMKEKFGEE